MTNLSKKIEILANVAIVVVAFLVGSVLVKDHLLAGRANAPASNRQEGSQAPKLNGAHLFAPDIDWTKTNQTLVLALSK
jgi:hypothetical protein